ncbi:MAG: sel1 repeat family protein [Proteobacteria bacterium]|nr:MAG: sel1 repeat family protein [Pseudomonadota bacterium]
MNYIFMLLSIFVVHALNAQQPNCDELFVAGEYDRVVEQCEDKLNKNDFQRFQWAVAQLYSKVQPQKFEEIFFIGHMFSKMVYEYKTGKKLNSNLEKYYINEAFKNIKSLQITNQPEAQLLIAKIYYISEIILQKTEQWSDGSSKDNGDYQKYFLDNVKSAADANPANTQANFLLGKESIKYKHVEGDPNGVYREISNKQLYPYLVKAAEQGHEFAQVWVDAVNHWHAHLEKLNNSAKSGSPGALYRLGMNTLAEVEEEPARYEQALPFFEQAYKKGHQPSLKMLSMTYRSLRMADQFVETLHALAKRNDAEAMLKLGDYYFCQGDKDSARTWYQNAQSNNNPLAQYALDDLNTSHSPYAGCGEF